MPCPELEAGDSLMTIVSLTLGLEPPVPVIWSRFLGCPFCGVFEFSSVAFELFIFYWLRTKYRRDLFAIYKILYQSFFSKEICYKLCFSNNISVRNPFILFIKQLLYKINNQIEPTHVIIIFYFLT